MRIAIVANPYISVPPPKYGGIENVIHFLIKGLLEKGHEPILIGTGDSVVDCPLIPFSDQAMNYPKSPSRLPKFESQIEAVNRKTRRILKKLLPDLDIIHSHGFDLLPFKNFPNLTTVHGMIDFQHLKYYEARKDLFFASISLNQRRPFPSLKWVANVYNGEDPDEYPINTKPDKYALFLGRFDHEKRPHHAIQLAIALGMKIKVAGKVDFQGIHYYKREIEPLIKHRQVEFLGEVGLAEKRQLVANAMYNFHPIGWREPFGLNVLEAAYAGTPTLAVARGSMRELIQHGRSGLLVEDFVEGYHSLNNNLQLDRKYVAERARQLFNYHRMTNGYLRAYRRVIKEFKL